jgi:hypothetical protein
VIVCCLVTWIDYVTMFDPAHIAGVLVKHAVVICTLLCTSLMLVACKRVL